MGKDESPAGKGTTALISIPSYSQCLTLLFFIAYSDCANPACDGQNT